VLARLHARLHRDAAGTHPMLQCHRSARKRAERDGQQPVRCILLMLWSRARKTALLLAAAKAERESGEERTGARGRVRSQWAGRARWWVPLARRSCLSLVACARLPTVSLSLLVGCFRFSKPPRLRVAGCVCPSFVSTPRERRSTEHSGLATTAHERTTNGGAQHSI
jgi:hypothetical protein